MEVANIFDTKIKEQKSGIKKSFPVTGMTCAACASSVESILSNTDGVNKATVNFASNSVSNEQTIVHMYNPFSGLTNCFKFAF